MSRNLGSWWNSRLFSFLNFENRSNGSKVIEISKNSSLTRYSECIWYQNCPGICKVHGTVVKKCPGNVPVFLSFSYPWSLCDILVSKVSRNCPGFLDLFQVTKDPESWDSSKLLKFNKNHLKWGILNVWGPGIVPEKVKSMVLWSKSVPEISRYLSFSHILGHFIIFFFKSVPELSRIPGTFFRSLRTLAENIICWKQHLLK